MISYSPMLPADILSLDLLNLDALSENFSMSYYMDYFLNFPLEFIAATSHTHTLPENTNLIYTRPIVGHAFGKKEEKEKLCYHLSVLSVAPCARKAGIGRQIIKMFEGTGNSYGAWFTDLFVRGRNKVAIEFYKRLGYKVYREIYGYYTHPHDIAFDMRKSLSVDTEKAMERQSKNINLDEFPDTVL
ncbi:N-alpha-acetyltransferase 20 [Glugoides intestinalis]